MSRSRNLRLGLGTAVLAGLATLSLTAPQWAADRPAPVPLPDAVADVQTPRAVPRDRPEQQLTEHDKSGKFAGDAAPHSSTALPNQPDKGEMAGFDFSRDPLGAKAPKQSAADIMKRAMVRVSRALRRELPEVRMLLQVHDELVLEVAPGERESLEELVRREVGAAVEMDVPLDVSVGVGRSWHDAAH